MEVLGHTSQTAHHKITCLCPPPPMPFPKVPYFIEQRPTAGEGDCPCAFDAAGGDRLSQGLYQHRLSAPDGETLNQLWSEMLSSEPGN